MSEFDESVESDPIADAILHGGNSFTDLSGADSGADVEPEYGADNDAGEELLLGKFKTAEDMAAAYQNLESQFTQDRQRLADDGRDRHARVQAGERVLEDDLHVAC